MRTEPWSRFVVGFAVGSGKAHVEKPALLVTVAWRIWWLGRRRIGQHLATAYADEKGT